MMINRQTIPDENSRVGHVVCIKDGIQDGTVVGARLGLKDEHILGTDDGLIKGATDGDAVGTTLGLEEGIKDGIHEGTVVGATLGL